MHRIDTEGNSEGLFQDGNPQVGQQGTILDAAWANDVQENIANVIVGVGAALAKGDYTQLKLAIAAMITNAQAAFTASVDDQLALNRIPVGTVILVDGVSTPSGYLAFDHEYLRETYPDLVAFYVGQGRLVAGSTADHFRTPVYQGRFIRLTSSDATIDPDGPRGPGSLQADAFASHSHALPSRSNANSGNGFVEDADSTGTIGTASTELSGGSETRPKNVALTPFIKF